MAHVVIQDVEAFAVLGKTEKPITAGDTTFQVRAVPLGLDAGDELLVDLFGTMERRTVSSVTDRTITVSSGFTYAHAENAVWQRADAIEALAGLNLGTATGAPDTYALDTYKVNTIADAATKWLASIWHDVTPTEALTNNDIESLHVTMAYHSAAAMAGSYLAALVGNLTIDGAANIGPQMLAGVWGAVTYTGTGTSIDTLMGVRGEVTASSGSGVLLAALYAATPVIDAAGVVAITYGVYIEDQDNTGTYTATTVYQLWSAGTSPSHFNGSLELQEMASAPSGSSNRARIFAEDNGSGKTRLMVQFGTGAAQQLAIEP